MIEKMWEILQILRKSLEAVLSKCAELGLDQKRGVVSLDESYINLNLACNILEDAIQKNKLIQLPISIQKNLVATLEAIVRSQAGLIAGTDEVVNLAEAIEKLNAYIWQYGLHNLSEEVLGYQIKLNQLKAMELAAVETQRKLQEGILVKENLERLLGEAETQSESLKTLMTGANTSAVATNVALEQATDASQKAAASLAIAQQNETASTQLLATLTKGNADILVYEANIKTLVSDFNTLKAELVANKTSQENLFKDFEGYRKTIDGLLGDSNRTGMAASFTKRKNDLNEPMCFGICGLNYWACCHGCNLFSSSS